LAMLYDSLGADVLEASSSLATMTYEDGTIVQFEDVQYVHAIASDDGQTDTALLSGRRHFEGRHGESKLYGDNNSYFIRAKYFDEVIASSSGGGIANLFDSLLDDVYSSGPGQSKMEYNDGTSVEALDFGRVHGLSQNGGSDRAILSDETAAGVGNAVTFLAFDTFCQLKHGHGQPSLENFFSRAWGFGEVRAVFSGNDEYVYLYGDPTRVDSLVIPYSGGPGQDPAEARFSNNNRTIYIDEFLRLWAWTFQDFVDKSHVDIAYSNKVRLEGNWDIV